MKNTTKIAARLMSRYKYIYMWSDSSMEVLLTARLGNYNRPADLSTDRQTDGLIPEVPFTIKENKTPIAPPPPPYDHDQPGCCSSAFTISICPCSAAHISALLPSSSVMLTSAPAAVNRPTMSSRPWLTASMRAVWPCWLARRFTSARLNSRRTTEKRYK